MVEIVMWRTVPIIWWSQQIISQLLFSVYLGTVHRSSIVQHSHVDEIYFHIYLCTLMFVQISTIFLHPNDYGYK